MIFLSFESRKHQVNLNSIGNMTFDSPGGHITMKSYNEIALASNKLISLNSKKVHMKNLPKAQQNQDKNIINSGDKDDEQVIAYQVSITTICPSIKSCVCLIILRFAYLIMDCYS